MDKKDIAAIEALLERVPRGPWHFCPGDDFDHWELYSNDPRTGISMVQDDADVPPDENFINYVLASRGIIESLLAEVKKKADQGV